MKIFTSYFGNFKKIPENIITVSIARFSPHWFEGRKMETLAPSRKLLRDSKQGKIDTDEYTKRYMAEIESLFDPDMLYAKLEKEFSNREIVLLCYEKSGEFCHRRLLAEWLGEKLGIEIKEL